MNLKSLATFLTVTTLSLPLYRVNAQIAAQFLLPVQSVKNYIDATASDLSWKEIQQLKEVNPRTGALLATTFVAQQGTTYYSAALSYTHKNGAVSKDLYDCKKKKLQRFYLVIRAKKANFVLTKSETVSQKEFNLVCSR